VFGGDPAVMDTRWKEWWLGQPDDPTFRLRAEAIVATMTSYFGRAFSQRQLFETVDEFFAAADAGELKSHKQDWLPPALARSTSGEARDIGEWSFGKRGGRTSLVVKLSTGETLEGSFQVSGGRVKGVEVHAKK
jgi:hypothetical protein